MHTFLSIEHPEVMASIREMPGGLNVGKFQSSDSFLLIVKQSKEAILAAVEKQYFSIYLCPVLEGQSFALMSAFWDDTDQPLVIMTPLLADDILTVTFIEMLHSQTVFVHFFDLLNIERAGFLAKIKSSDHADRILRNPIDFGGAESLVDIHDDAWDWFANRTSADDARAITIELEESLFSEDIFVIDANGPDTRVATYGTSLRRTGNPGDMQEPEIATILAAVFEEGSVYINPYRTDRHNELCDVLVETDELIIVVQAKDSPNDVQTLFRTISRKRKSWRSKLKEGLAQTVGAIKHLSATDFIDLTDNTRASTNRVQTSNKPIYGLVVVPEIVDDERDEYAKFYTLHELANLHAIVPLSFTEIANYCHRASSAEAFIKMICDIYLHSKIEGVLPKLRFGYV